MLNNGLKALAPLGLAAVLALGLSACGGESSPPTSPQETAAEANPCTVLTQGGNQLNSTLYVQANATPAPVNPSELRTSDDVRDTDFSDTQYVVGWTDLKASQFEAVELEDVKIVTFEGARSEGCKIHDLEGGRDQDASPSDVVFTYVGTGIPTDGKKGYLSFVNPYDADVRVVLELWNLSGGTPSNNEFNLIEAMGDVDLY